MAKLLKKYLLGLLAVGLFVPTTIYANTELTNKEKAEEYANMLIKNAGLTDIQYALIKDGEIILSNAISKDNTLTTDTMSPIASVSKMYVTAAIMMLVDDGLVNLDEPVITYIPEFEMADERYKDITVRMLLNHSSGFMGVKTTNTLLYNDNDTSAHDTLLNSLKMQTLKANPGEFSTYCSDGFSLAEIIVERVSGATFTQFIQENISQPLGLTKTKTPQDEFDLSQIIPTPTGPHTSDSIQTNTQIATAGMYSTAEEIALFGYMFTNEELLSQESIDMTMAPEYANGLWHGEEDTFAQYGLGWDDVEVYPFFEQNIQVVTKGGDHAPHHTALVVAPEQDMSVAVLMTGPKGSSAYAEMMGSRLLFDEMTSDGVQFDDFKKPFDKPTQAVPIPPDLKKYNGIYSSNMGMTKVEMTDSGVMLYTGLDKENKQPSIYYHLGDGIFRNSFRFEISFVEEDNGETYLKTRSIMDIGLIPYEKTEYSHQKIEPISVDESVKKAWEDRAGKMYLVVSEKYSSRIYTHPTFSNAITYTLSSYNPVEGYFDGMQIIDENTLMHKIKIPQNSGRDLSTTHMYIENGVEYMNSNEIIYVDFNSIPNLSQKTITIGENGYGQYYHITDEYANRMLSTETTGNWSIMVYNSEGECIYNSWLDGNKDVILPEDGLILFAGDVGTSFNLKIN
ncbi:hypothetical protein AN640_07465 [Candidatus Epulonipiscium fishelsonii]|uniref:Uncharacterized protein n=1 Tax=Candidatus Epulonipiscium fishelsonii TaxID=77094 RepID=A0ACC8XGB8_9FIRM|nr:hypothetical protein AN640_07465 [Epulopiscium sp. SCG-D08WGA-EpuloA1]